MINYKRLPNTVARASAERIYALLANSTAPAKHLKENQQRAAKVAAVLSKSADLEKFKKELQTQAYGGEVGQIFKKNNPATLAKDLAAVELKYAAVVARGRDLVAAIPGLKKDLQVIFQIAIADTFTIAVSAPAETPPPPANNETEYLAPFALGYSTNSNSGVIGNTDHSEDFATGNVSGSCNAYSGLGSIAVYSTVGQFVTVPSGFSKMTVSYNLSVSRYEFSCGSGLGFSEADYNGVSFIQTDGNDNVDWAERRMLESAPFRNTTISGSDDGWHTRRDFDVQAGQSLLVACGIMAVAGAVQLGGAASATVRGQIKSIKVNFHN